MTRNRKIMHIFLIFLLLTVLNDKRLDAQSGTSSAISGTVTDATGAALTDAAVTASDLETKAVRQGKSNAEGRFLFSQVNPGRYTVTVGAPGFAGQTSQPVCSRGGAHGDAEFPPRACRRQRRRSKSRRNQALLEPGESEYHYDA